MSAQAERSNLGGDVSSRRGGGIAGVGAGEKQEVKSQNSWKKRKRSKGKKGRKENMEEDT